MSPQQRIEELQRFKSSNAWTILKQEMEDAILMSAYQLADNKPLTLEELHFRRGALYAAKKFLDLPEQLVMKAQNEISLMVDKEFNS
jgi:hypothetical protein